jgi:hypothetical protein
MWPLLCTMDITENLWQIDSHWDGQYMLCSLLHLTSFLWQMLSNISVADSHSLENMRVLYQWIWSDELYQKQFTSELCTVHIEEVGEVWEVTVSGLPALGNEPVWSPVWKPTCLSVSRVSKFMANSCSNSTESMINRILTTLLFPIVVMECDKKLGHTIVKIQNTHILNGTYTLSESPPGMSLWTPDSDPGTN